MNSIFIFTNAIHQADWIRFDLEGDFLTFWCNSQKVAFDLRALQTGSSTVILKTPRTGSVYPLFNYREILQMVDMEPQEFLQSLQINAYVQIDKSGDDTFIKVFLPVEQDELESRTHNFSKFPHVTMADLHKLDRLFSWSISKIDFNICRGRIEGTLYFNCSSFWKEPVFVNHAGQSQELKQGKNFFSFSWSPTEDLYCGAIKGRYKGRALHVVRHYP